MVKLPGGRRKELLADAQAVKCAIEFAYPEKKVKAVFSSVQGPPSKRN